MKLVFLIAASAHEDWSDQARDLYKKKILHFFPLEITEVRLKKSSRDNSVEKMNTDSESLLNSIKDDDYVILFDEKSQLLDSIKFSKKLENALSSGKKRLVFVIGGAYGFSEDIKKRAQLLVSFSPMTFNHLVAQTVALEQIYRALTIYKNIPYHNQ